MYLQGRAEQLRRQARAYRKAAVCEGLPTHHGLILMAEQHEREADALDADAVATAGTANVR
jgi:hypothetical protein